MISHLTKCGFWILDRDNPPVLLTPVTAALLLIPWTLLRLVSTSTSTGASSARSRSSRSGSGRRTTF